MDTLTVRSPAGLGIRILRSGFKATGSAYTEAMKEEGSLVSGERILPWKIESIAEGEDEVVLSGPDFEGESLDSPLPPQAAMERLATAAKAFAALSRAGRLPPSFLSPGILLSPSGDLLVLSPSVAARAFSFLDDSVREGAVAALSSPRGGGSEAEASFFLAQAVYRACAGKGAFAPPGPDRKSPYSTELFVPSVLAAPRLDRALAGLVDRALADPAAAGIAAWSEALAAARERGFFRELPAEEEAELEKRRLAFESALDRKRKRSRFLKKRGGLLIGIGATLAIIGSIAGSVLGSAASRPDYSAYEPRRVVETYYAAINGLDIESLEACSEKSARVDSTFVMNLTVITKTRMAYEGKSPIVYAEDWLAAGSPKLSSDAFLFGIAGLSLAEIPAAPGESAMEARYSLWTLDRSGEAASPLELRRIDRIRLAKGKKGWKIAALERQES